MDGEGVGKGFGFADSICPKWNSMFKERAPIVPEDENTPYVNSLSEQLTDKSSDDRISLVRAFMGSPNDSEDMYNHQAEFVDQLCFPASIEALEDRVNEKESSSVAWLDEKSNRGGRVRPRSQRGALTPRALYKALLKPRFIVSTPSQVGPSHDTSRSSSDPLVSDNLDNGDKAESIDADRQLIFITDLDAWSIYALIGTVSENGAIPLRAAISRHLAYESLISAPLPPKGLLYFQLSFDLPYYALRVGDGAQEDKRRCKNGNSLRRCDDVTPILGSSNSGARKFLHEAQVSCTIAGRDEHSWVAYFFIDTYFESSRSKETVERYTEDRKLPAGMSTDPLTKGEQDADDSPIWDPRRYFLLVLEIRLRQIKNEWQRIVRELKQSVENYERDYHPHVAQSKERTSRKAAKQHYRHMRESRNYIIVARNLVRKVLSTLTKTLQAWDRFERNNGVIFQDMSQPHGVRSISAIRLSIENLQSCQAELEDLAARCEIFDGGLGLHINHEAIELGNRQIQLSQDTVLMMLAMTPVALSAGIFGMQPTVLPSVPQNAEAFFLSMFILTALILLLRLLQQPFGDFVDSLREFIGGFHLHYALYASTQLHTKKLVHALSSRPKAQSIEDGIESTAFNGPG